MNYTLKTEEDELLQRVYNGEESFTEEELSYLHYEYDRFDFIKGENRRWSRNNNTILKIEDKYFSILCDEGLTEGQENSYEFGGEVKLTQEVKTITVNTYKK